MNCHHSDHLEQTRPVSFRQALLFWLKLGFISFGGPGGQIAIMHQELVERRRWISERRFLHALNYCMLLPGPEAQQLATYIGWLMHRSWGGVVAGTLFVLPSLLILIALSWVYLEFGEVPAVAAVFYGIKPAIAAVVVHAAWRIGSRVLKHKLQWVIAITALLAIGIFEVPFPFIVLGAALLGYVAGRFRPEIFTLGGEHKIHTSYGYAWIDDHSPIPVHAQFRLPKLLSVIAIGALLWLLPMTLLSLVFGWRHDFTQMGWFFSKAALLTFGGAYAVLPYVYQGAVETYGWLSSAQMIDGLALGESTPGPLIMVVAFVGFIGGYLKALLGTDALFLAGATAAIIATWFTFLPSFLFILAGGPLIESTHGELKFTAPLTAISAAVVGVIVNLGLFFGYHVLWPEGFEGRVDMLSALIVMAALAGLFYFKQTAVYVILLCAAAGLMISVALPFFFSLYPS